MIKLRDIYNEIKVNQPGKFILFGYNNRNIWTQLVKVQGYKSKKEALYDVNKLIFQDRPNVNQLYWEIMGNENNTYKGDKIPFNYMYLEDDGDVVFANSLPEFGPGYQTEEGWNIKEWLRTPPKSNINEIKVNKPINPLEILKIMVQGYDNSYFSRYRMEISLEDFLREYDNGEEDDKEMIKLAPLFYKWKDENKIWYTEVEDSEESKFQKLPTQYKSIITTGLGYNNVEIILHNF
jgi:hypothetical protein